MDWLKGMNSVIEHIEENLTQPIRYESLSRIVGCSVYEFSRIFSFMAGMSISEYIRRRRLSQAAFDIQSGREKMIDIALKYCYESPTTFTRAFKELHGAAPLSARKTGVSLKTYPPISFILTLKGVNGLKFRIEKTAATTLYGTRTGISPSSDTPVPTGYQSHNGIKHDDEAKHFDRNNLEELEALSPGASASFQNPKLSSITISPRHTGWQGNKARTVTAYDFALKDGYLWYLTGGEATSPNDTLTPDTNWKTQALPPAIWAVFILEEPPNPPNWEAITQMYTRIHTEWFPTSGYRRDETIPHLEINTIETIKDYNEQPWEIWIPVISK